MYFILEILLYLQVFLLQCAHGTVVPSQVDGYSRSDVELINPWGFPAPFAIHVNRDVSGYLLFVMFSNPIDDT